MIKRHEEVTETQEIERINKIKKPKEIETTKKELEELEIWKINETIANIPKEIVLPSFWNMFFNW